MTPWKLGSYNVVIGNVQECLGDVLRDYEGVGELVEPSLGLGLTGGRVLSHTRRRLLQLSRAEAAHGASQCPEGRQ